VSTAIFDAYNAWLALIKTALPTLAANGAIYDGPQAGYVTNTDFVVVGADDLTTTGPVVAVDSGQQQWIALRNAISRTRDEEFPIFAVLGAWIGNDDFAACRARAKTNLNAIFNALAPDLTLGGALTPPGWSGMTVTGMSIAPSPDGPALHVPFTLTCRARV